MDLEADKEDKVSEEDGGHLDMQVREIFGVFSLKKKKEMQDASERFKALPTSDNYLFLRENEPGLEKQREKWMKEGVLDEKRVGGPREAKEISKGTAILEEMKQSDDQQYKDDDPTIVKKTGEFVFFNA